MLQLAQLLGSWCRCFSPVLSLSLSPRPLPSPPPGPHISLDRLIPSRPPSPPGDAEMMADHGGAAGQAPAALAPLSLAGDTLFSYLPVDIHILISNAVGCCRCAGRCKGDSGLILRLLAFSWNRHPPAVLYLLLASLSSLTHYFTLR